ncbi:MAG: aminotransferase class III-fold pyridoxal phosphate-dependent enzyme, partial [Chlorobiales bacterium]|nr:aminotransferase class III-fold pyridoxal phosphate-dependent enzyme [Chlorobiales bacterium]
MHETTQTESLTLEKESQLFFHTYSRLPLHVSHGEGVYLFSADGRKFLDMVSGIGVNAVGYGNERLIKAIEEQTRKIIHASNLFMLDPQFKLAEKLLKESGLSKVFFANSGTEAIEGAIKLSRKWASKQAVDKRQVLALTNSFHGRTYGAVSLTAKAKYHEGFEPLLPETGFITFNDLDDLEAKVSDKTAAVFLEFVQGEGGVFPVSEAFVRKLDELRKKHNFLVVADEIQAGCGRTGKFFSYMYYDFVPDVVCSAKPLGGGLPLAAIIGNVRVEDAFEK